MPEISTIADIVRVQARRRPDAAALVVGERTISFRELDARSSQAAQAFRAAGAGVGDRVAVSGRLAPPEMPHVIEDAQASIVVVGSEFFGHLEAIENRLTTVTKMVTIGAHDRWQEFEDWLAGHPGEDPGVTTGSDDIALLMYTSDTTGLPKGVMLSNG